MKYAMQFDQPGTWWHGMYIVETLDGQFQTIGRPREDMKLVLFESPEAMEVYRKNAGWAGGSKKVKAVVIK